MENRSTSKLNASGVDLDGFDLDLERDHDLFRSLSQRFSVVSMMENLKDDDDELSTRDLNASVNLDAVDPREHGDSDLSVSRRLSAMVMSYLNDSMMNMSMNMSFTTTDLKSSFKQPLNKSFKQPLNKSIKQPTINESDEKQHFRKVEDPNSTDCVWSPGRGIFLPNNDKFKSGNVDFNPPPGPSSAKQDDFAKGSYGAAQPPNHMSDSMPPPAPIPIQPPNYISASLPSPTPVTSLVNSTCSNPAQYSDALAHFAETMKRTEESRKQVMQVRSALLRQQQGQNCLAGGKVPEAGEERYAI